MSKEMPKTSHEPGPEKKFFRYVIHKDIFEFERELVVGDIINYDAGVVIIEEVCGIYLKVKDVVSIDATYVGSIYDI